MHLFARPSSPVFTPRYLYTKHHLLHRTKRIPCHEECDESGVLSGANMPARESGPGGTTHV
jgi:hypothetical protein